MHLIHSASKPVLHVTIVLLQQREVFASVGLTRDVRIVFTEDRSVRRHDDVVVHTFRWVVSVCEWLVTTTVVAAAATQERGGGGLGAECDRVRSHNLQACQLCFDSLVELTLDVIEPLGGLGDVEGDREWVEEFVEVPGGKGGGRGRGRGGEGRGV